MGLKLVCLSELASPLRPGSPALGACTFDQPHSLFPHLPSAELHSARPPWPPVLWLLRLRLQGSVALRPPRRLCWHRGSRVLERAQVSVRRFLRPHHSSRAQGTRGGALCGRSPGTVWQATVATRGRAAVQRSVPCRAAVQCSVPCRPDWLADLTPVCPTLPAGTRTLRSSCTRPEAPEHRHPLGCRCWHQTLLAHHLLLRLLRSANGMPPGVAPCILHSAMPSPKHANQEWGRDTCPLPRALFSKPLQPMCA